MEVIYHFGSSNTLQRAIPLPVLSSGFSRVILNNPESKDFYGSLLHNWFPPQNSLCFDILTSC